MSNGEGGRGCYLPLAEKRVCIDCYMGAAGSMPLPSSAPAGFGGAFADAQRLAESKADEARAAAAERLNRAGKKIVAGVAGFREWRDEKKKETREAKEAFWKEMPEEVQEIRNTAKKEIDAVVNPIRKQAHDAGDAILDRANKLLDELF